MWTETGLMQVFPFVTAPKGAGVGEPSDEDGFAALVAVPFSEAVEDADAQEAGGPWPAWAGVPLSQEMQLPRAGSSGAGGDAHFQPLGTVVSEVARKLGTALTAEPGMPPDGAGETFPLPGLANGGGPASGGSLPMAGRPASGAAGGLGAGAEVLSMVPEAVSEALAGRGGLPLVRLEHATSVSGAASKGADPKILAVNEGSTVVPVAKATDAETAASPGALGSATVLPGMGDPSEATGSGGQTGPGAAPPEKSGAEAGGSVVGAAPVEPSVTVLGHAPSLQSMIQAGSAWAVPVAGGSALEQSRGEGVEPDGVAQAVALPHAPVSSSGDKAAKADDVAPREDEAVAPERALPPHGQVDVAETLGRNIEENGPVEGPVATKAERIWLGLLQWSEAGAEVARMGRGDGVVGAPTLGNGPVLHGIGAWSQALAAPQGQASGAAALAMPELTEQVLRESDSAAFAILPHGQPFLTGAPAASTLPAAAVPQLALGIVAHLQQRADGKTEIALSPAELGSVRLRLETDARDPDRIIVHLAFDRPETMDLFRRHADQLSEAIRAAGYAEARLDFGQHGTSEDAGAGQDAAHRRGAAAGEAETGPPASQAVPNPGSPLRSGSPTGLDLRL